MKKIKMSNCDLTWIFSITLLEMHKIRFFMQNMRASFSQRISERSALDLSLFIIHAMLNNFFRLKKWNFSLKNCFSSIFAVPIKIFLFGSSLGVFLIFSYNNKQKRNFFFSKIDLKTYVDKLVSIWSVSFSDISEQMKHL